ncbi:MAG: NTP transferase domain-containing protein [Christensenellales bacterium]|jgi:NDP-sugar pyrophosphorylase family protein
MTSCVVLCAGKGSKMWPYATIRPKAMIPLCTRPLIQHTIEGLLELGMERIVIAADRFHGQFYELFGKENRIEVIDVGQSLGSAQSLSRALGTLQDERFMVLYGDMFLTKKALSSFVKRARSSSQPLLLSHRVDEGIVVNSKDGIVTGMCGQAREGSGQGFAGISCDRRMLRYLNANPGYFRDVQVGVMSPLESFLEQSVALMAQDITIEILQLQNQDAVDLDRPWDILRANRLLAHEMCEELDRHELASNAQIDDSANIRGFVRLGKNSRVGRNVIIEGNAIIGDDTLINNGAILMGNNVIGHGNLITNSCYVDKYTVVGNGCVINHCAEICGVVFDGAYLYHYMHIYGVVGEHTDIGAATVCGTLRFDDGRSSHLVKGRKEIPANDANATYIGDFCRTGVNVTFWPGKRVGVYSVIGAGTILDQDVPDKTLIYPKQELLIKEWGSERYGW